MIIIIIIIILTTLRLLAFSFQPANSETIFISGMTKAPKAPAFALHDIPFGTCRERQKHGTKSPGMLLSILTARDGTFEFPG